MYATTIVVFTFAILLLTSGHSFSQNFIPPVNDSILKPVAADSLLLQMQADSMQTVQDSISKNDLSRRELRQQAKIQKDSLKAIRDSIRLKQPQIMQTYIFHDSLRYKRMLTWNHDQMFNNVISINPDTTFNDNYNDYPFMKKDVGATYLGISGSATQIHNYFKRERFELFEPFAPYLIYSSTPETLPFYNVKTPYTELGYWGTLFADRNREESEVRFMHTQNLSPKINMNISHRRYGAKGQMENEATDNRTFNLSANYIGERYIMHAGYIYQGISRSENGGVSDEDRVLYPKRYTEDNELNSSKDLPYYLGSANNRLKRNTLFLTHSYGIPIRFSSNDTISDGDGTITYFGHSFEYSTYYKKYTDNISLADEKGRNYYNNTFLVSETDSYDSIRVNRLENKLFIRLQPWAKDAIVSKLDAGIADQYLSIYSFRPEYYISGKKNVYHNNIYLYAGASGNFKQYFEWDATAQYHILGYYANNFSLDARARLSFFPVKEGIHLTGKFSIDNRRPNWFNESYYSNHFEWDNSGFGNITETRIEGNLDIPYFNASIFMGNSVITNHVYYGVDSKPLQFGSLLNILSAYLQKNFKIGILNLNNRILFQKSSDEEIIPLPALSLNLRYYIQFNVVKDVLTAQIGGDVVFNTKYYAPSYNPALGVFHNQKDREIGDYPYIDAFINLQWKKASLFFKYINAAQGWPSFDYFSANHYIRPQPAFKFGIFWPFYVNPA